MYSNTIILRGVERGFSRVWTGDRGFNVRLLSGGFRFKSQNLLFLQILQILQILIQTFQVSPLHLN